MNINDIKTGDTLLTTDKKSFLSRSIVKVMKKYAKKNNISYPTVESHSARFVWIADELYVFGSIDSGYKPWIFKDHYDFNDPNRSITIMRRKTSLTQSEIDKTTNYCLHLTAVSLMYQYWNFIQWLLLVYLNINLFRKDSEDFTYCYEAEMLCRKNLDPTNYGTDTYQTDFFKLINDPNYEIIYSK